MRYQVDDAGLLAYLDRVAPDLYRRVSRLTSGDRQLTEELVREAVSELVRQARSRTLSEVEVGWLTTTARKGFIECIRFRSGHDRSVERQRKPNVSLGGIGGIGGIGDAVTPSTDQARWLLGRLPVRERWALALQVVDGLSLAEVATALSWTLGATKAVLGGARRRLRELVDNEHGVDEPALFDRVAEDITPEFVAQLRSMVTAGRRPADADEPVHSPAATASARRGSGTEPRRRLRLVTLASWAVVVVAIVAVILANRGNPFVAPAARAPNESGLTPSGATLRPPVRDAETTSPPATSTGESTSTTQAATTTPATDVAPVTGASSGTGAGTGTDSSSGTGAGTGTTAGKPPSANVTDVSGPWPDSGDQDTPALAYLVPTTGVDGLNLQRKWDIPDAAPSTAQGAVPYDQVLLSPDARVQLRITTQAEPIARRPATDDAFAIGPWLASPVRIAAGFSALDLHADAGVVRLWSHGLTGNELDAVAEGLVRRAHGEPGWDLGIRPRDVEPFVEDWQIYGPLRTMGWYTAGGALKGELDYGLIGFDGLADAPGTSNDSISTMSIRGRQVVVTLGEGFVRMWWKEADGSYVFFGLNDRDLDDAVAVAESLVVSDRDAWLAMPQHPPTPGDGCDSLFC